MPAVTANAEIYGAEVNVTETGLVTITVPHFITTFDEIFTVGRAKIRGFPQAGRNAIPYGDTGYQVRVSYQGLDESLATIKELWEWDSSFNEEPLEAHPNIDSLKSTYGGYLEDGELKFPEKMPKKKATAASSAAAKREAAMAKKRAANPLYSNRSSLSLGALGATGSSVTARASGKNPMFGQKTYLVFHAVARCTYATAEPPTDTREKIGTVIKNLPGREGRAFSKLHDVRSGNWLIMTPRVTPHGNAYEVQEEYLLNLAGWPPSQELAQIIRK